MWAFIAALGDLVVLGNTRFVKRITTVLTSKINHYSLKKLNKTLQPRNPLLSNINIIVPKLKKTVSGVA